MVLDNCRLHSSLPKLDMPQNRTIPAYEICQRPPQASAWRFLVLCGFSQLRNILWNPLCLDRRLALMGIFQEWEASSAVRHYTIRLALNPGTLGILAHVQIRSAWRCPFYCRVPF